MKNNKNKSKSKQKYSNKNKNKNKKDSEEKIDLNEELVQEFEEVNTDIPKKQIKSKNKKISRKKTKRARRF